MQNKRLIADNFERFAAGDIAGVMSTWADDAEWHILDANPWQGTHTKAEYFTKVLAEISVGRDDYRLNVESIAEFGTELVVVHVTSTGTNIDPGGGLVIYRVVADKVVEGWALSRGRDANLPF